MCVTKFCSRLFIHSLSPFFERKFMRRSIIEEKFPEIYTSIHNAHSQTIYNFRKVRKQEKGQNWPIDRIRFVIVPCSLYSQKLRIRENMKWKSNPRVGIWLTKTIRKNNREIWFIRSYWFVSKISPDEGQGFWLERCWRWKEKGK